MSQPEDLAVVQRHVAALAEHFESVQVFCTRPADDGKGTVNVQYGAGNWFARYGQVASWLTKQDEGSRIEVRGE